jgi:hypothetical protein
VEVTQAFRSALSQTVLRLGGVEQKRDRLQEAMEQMTNRSMISHAQRLGEHYGEEQVRLKALLETVSTGIAGTFLRSLHPTSRRISGVATPLPYNRTACRRPNS